MGSHAYAVAQGAYLLRLPGAPHDPTKRRLLEEFLANPFLDDDVSSLAVRANAPEAEVAECLLSLCRDGVLCDAGQRGWMLDLSAVELDSQSAAAEAGPVPATTSGMPPAAASIGVILFDAEGHVQYADAQAVSWLGADPGSFDAAAFYQMTGVHPSLVLEAAPQLTFTLEEPQPLTVALHACCLGTSPCVLTVVQAALPVADAASVHAYLQEELFTRLRAAVVAPMLLIQEFLDSPDPESLGQARAALEEVNGFLDEFLLSDRSEPSE